MQDRTRKRVVRLQESLGDAQVSLADALVQTSYLPEPDYLSGHHRISKRIKAILLDLDELLERSAHYYREQLEKETA
jgi:hypothetical protein